MKKLWEKSEKEKNKKTKKKMVTDRTGSSGPTY
jgi:hypothetical protein